LFIYCAVTTALYLGSIVFLLWEFRATPCEDRFALQTVPLLMGTTALYLALIVKTQSLVTLFLSV